MIMKRKTIFVFLFTITLLTVICSSCSSETSAEATPTIEATVLVETAPVETAPPPADDDGLTVTTPTPKPTAVPGAVTGLIETVTEAAGIKDTEVLGMTTDNWINLGVSLLLIFFGVTIGGRFAIYLLRHLTNRLSTELDEAILRELEPHIRWLVGTLFVQVGIERLLFISIEIKEFFQHFYFVIYLIIITSAFWKIVDYTLETYIRELAQKSDAERSEQVLVLLRRVSHIVILTFSTQVLLSRFGIQIGAMATALGIGGLALSLAAQDVLSDMISGFIILISQPYRIGDRIEIQGLGTWGDVVEIGSRTTSIRTRDNRLVIVPNSTIGKSQIVNYTFPDPRYRVQIEIGIGYGQDIEKIRQIIIDTVKQVEGVLPNKPVDALYVAMGDSAMTFRVRWWIESYIDTRQMFDAVNTALQKALDEAGVEMPFPTQDINVNITSRPATEQKFID